MLWTAAAAVLTAAAGAWPSWRLGGEPAVRAMAAAGLCAWLAFASAGLIMLKPAVARVIALRFLASAPLRAAGLVVLVLAAWKVADLPPIPLLLWAAIFYMALLSAETLWLAKLLWKSPTGR